MTPEEELAHRANLMSIAPHCHLRLCDKASATFTSNRIVREPTFRVYKARTLWRKPRLAEISEIEAEREGVRVAMGS